MAHKLIRKIQVEGFDPSQLDQYMLLLSIGISDLQVSVLHIKRRTCLLIEDYWFEKIRTVKDRMRAISTLFDEHLFLKGGFWYSIRVGFKGHKFTFIPQKLKIPLEKLPDFVTLNNTLNPAYERIYVSHHERIGVHNAFAADSRLVEWLRARYQSDKFTLTHQSSALIEASLSQMQTPDENKMFVLYDQRVLHLLMLKHLKLCYYNQFAIKEQKDIVSYVRKVADMLHFSVTDAIVLYGSFPNNASSIGALSKYFPKVKLGTRATHLNYAHAFDALPSHRYYDLIGISLCRGFYAI